MNVERFLSSTWIGIGTLAGKAIGVILFMGWVILQFTIWRQLNGLLCALAYGVQIVIFYGWFSWVTRMPSDAERHKMIAEALGETKTYSSLAEKNAWARLDETVKRMNHDDN